LECGASAPLSHAGGILKKELAPMAKTPVSSTTA